MLSGERYLKSYQVHNSICSRLSKDGVTAVRFYELAHNILLRGNTVIRTKYGV